MSNPNSTCEEPDGNTAPCIIKKKRSLPGHPDPDAEVIALSPRSLLATNRFVCEICNKGFQRDQNLQLHRRGHNLPWRLKQKGSHEVKKKVYICPESTCAHHDPSRALGDLTGIKKHFSRKHGEKKWKCDKCSKRYAVQSDWKAHQKTCGTREYRCDCGTLFSRRDSFITHRAFCDALAEENAKTLTCRQGESQETPPANLDHNSHIASLGEDFSAAIKAPSSPTSQITRDIFAYTEVSKPQYTDRRASDFTSQEGSIVSNWVRRASDFVSPEGSVASKWVPGSHKSKIAASSKSPGLSLCLGMGPGPGPPGSLQQMMANLEGSGPPFNLLSHDTLDKLTFPHTSVYDTNMHASSSSSSMGAMGMLSSLFSSPKHGYGRRVDVGNGMFSALGFAGSFNELDDSTMRQFAAPSSRLSTSISSSMSGSENPLKGSSQHAAASSATALLQKAAQMGATASKPSLLQKFGIGGLGETMGPQEMQRQPTWNGVSSMYSSSNSKPRQAGEYASHGDVAADGCGVGGSAKVPTCASTCELISGYGSMQGFMRSVTAGGGGSIQNTWDDIPLSERGVPLPPRTAAGAARSSLSSLSAQSGLRMATPPPAGLQGQHRRDHEGETPMVDFLGVGGSSGMVGLYSKCRNPDGHRSLSSE